MGLANLFPHPLHAFYAFYELNDFYAWKGITQKNGLTPDADAMWHSGNVINDCGAWSYRYFAKKPQMQRFRFDLAANCRIMSRL